MREPVLTSADRLGIGESFRYFRTTPNHPPLGPFTVRGVALGARGDLRFSIVEDEYSRTLRPDTPVEVLVDSLTVPGFTG
jgi:hypothetical protein